MIDARALHHVGIAVPSIEEALPFYRDTLGYRPGDVRAVAHMGVRLVFLETGGTRIELVEPTSADAGVARFLASRGRPAALHHLCFAVPDLARALAQLERSGVALVDRASRPGPDGPVAFLHPSAGSGVLVELLEVPYSGPRKA